MDDIWGIAIVIVILLIWYYREECRKDSFRQGMWNADDDFLEDSGLGLLSIYFRPDSSLQILMADNEANILVNESFDYSISGGKLILDRKCPMMDKEFKFKLDEENCCITMSSDDQLYARVFKDGEATMMTNE